MTLDKQLREEYERLFRTCQIRPEHQKAVDADAVRIEKSRDRYMAVGAGTAIPWWIIGAIHMLESNGSFNRHLHNGDPLKARTVRVPAGRPVTGDPPFTWETSAKDAVRFAGLHRVQTWDLARALYQLEDYNGWGYRKYGINSPYLWSCTNHYKSGLYVKDGKFSATAISQQAGAAAIIRRMAERGLNLDAAPQPTVHFSREIVHAAYALQTFLNEHMGATLRVDGRPGERTSDAFKAAFGVYLRGDPRSA